MQREMTVRICATCSLPLKFSEDGTQSGIYCDDEYYHEGACIEKSFEGTGESWDTHYTDDGDCYYTEWPLEFNDEGNQL